MKAQSPAIYAVAAIVLIVIVAALLFTFAGGTAKGLAAIDPLKERQFNDNKAAQLKMLESIYDTFKSNDKNNEGFDSYEASFLITKVIEYTWKDCSGFCREAGDIPEFTNFFLDHPIKLGKKLDCDYEKSEYPSEFPIRKASIRGLCTDKDIGNTGVIFGTDTKSETVDEWTVTMWGLLKNTNMCSSYYVDGYIWGNGDCGSSEKYVNDYKKCASGCAKAGPLDSGREISSDRIKGWEGKMEKGMIYGKIKVTYDPDCTWVAGTFADIPVIGGTANYIWTLKQPCSAVEIGVNEKCITTDNPPKEFNSGECFGNTVNTFYCNNGAIEDCGKNKDTSESVDWSLCQNNKGCK